MTARASCCAIAAVLAVVIAACGGGDGPKEIPEGPPVGKGAPKVKVGWVKPRYKSTGGIAYCTDTTSAARQESVDRFNARYNRRGPSVRLIRMPIDTWGQYDKFIKLRDECDVFDADVIATGALASKGLVYDTSAYVERRRDEFVGNAVRTACYGARFWGVPHSTNVGLLFRTARGFEPVNWGEAYHSIAFQGRTDEALTVNFLELAVAAGGRVLAGNGNSAVLDDGDRNPNLRALRLMVDAVNNTTAKPQDGETATVRAFRRGEADYMRNWPAWYQRKYWTGRGVSRRHVRIAPLPLFEDAGVGAVLGGANLVISTKSGNPQAALAFIDYLTTVPEQKHGLAQFEPPAIDAAYEGAVPSFGRDLGDYAKEFVRELRRAVKQATPRPVVPGYRRISSAIATNVRRALEGKATPEEAIAEANEQIDEIVRTAPLVATCTG